MDAKTAALDILFADNIDELEDNGGRDAYAEALGVNLFMTNHWWELRNAAKKWLRDNLKFADVYMRGLPGLPPL